MAMAPENAKPSPISAIAPPPPPRTLNVQRFAESRALELDSLHSIISTRLNHDFRIRRDKRRRTTGHNTATKNFRRPKRRKLGDGDGSEPVDEGGHKSKKVSRKTRRRKELRSNPSSGFCTSGDGTRRLRTHLWHAKRFTMVKRWGFHLPLGLHGRGRGSRAVLKWFKHGSLLHDASYCIPIQIEGPEESILSILRMVLFPSPSAPSVAPEELYDWVAHGVCYENAMLYHIEAPVSKLIAPIIYMWRPFLRDNDHARVKQDGVSSSSGSSNKDECSSPKRKLWIWIHAAAFDEGFDVLNTACQKQIHECGVIVRCFALEGQIARLDVMGSKATEMLKKIIYPVSQSSASENSLLNAPCPTACTNLQVQKSILFCHAEKLPSRAIISLTVHDPRDLPSSGTEVTDNKLSTSLERDLQGEDSLWSRPETNGIFLSDSRSLWDCSNNFNPPIPENSLCKERQDRRLKDFYLESSNHGGMVTEGTDDPRRSCSILLLKHAEQGGFCMGWSIILPLCWVKAFWISLVSHGFRVIGLRERRWVACNSGLPSFPFDFPDCKAYSSFMTDEAAAFDKASGLRPPAVRPLRVPIPPPWNCIVSTVVKGLNILRGSMRMDVQTSAGVVRESPMISLDSKDIALTTECQAAAIFPGFIPRIPKVLDWYFEKIGYGNLLSLPDIRIVKNGTLDWVKMSANMMDVESKLCFVRVLLHAYKEGVFEEGAIVCAPLLTDLSRWTSRSEGEEDHEIFQVPESFVRSCFTVQESGKWELQDPEDCMTMQTFRWPIGFVTTGFVYGSSKPVAVALCEARLLAMLRVQQSNDTQITESKIFVFVRNMRSTAYRRAQATIVLEHHNDDLVFM